MFKFLGKRKNTEKEMGEVPQKEADDHIEPGKDEGTNRESIQLSTYGGLQGIEAHYLISNKSSTLPRHQEKHPAKDNISLRHEEHDTATGHSTPQEQIYSKIGFSEEMNDYMENSVFLRGLNPLPAKSRHYGRSEEFICLLQDGKLSCESGLYYSGRFNENITISRNEKTVVSLAYHKMFGWVALKTMLKNFHTGYQIMKRDLVQRHSNICILFYYFMKEQFLHVVTEIHDYNLKDYLTKYSDLTFHKRCRLVLEMFRGLEFLHSKNVIHRDIKPENLLLNTDGVLRIADFDISRCIDKDEHHRTVHIGANLWLPPELNDVQNEVYIQEENDVYAATLVMFFIYRNQHPFIQSMDRAYSLLQLCESKKNLKFSYKLTDPFLHKRVKLFLSHYKNMPASKMICMLHCSHRIKDAQDVISTKIFERSKGKRIAFLGNSKSFSPADIYKLEDPLATCGFEVTTTECYLSMFIESFKIKATKVQASRKDVYIFVYLSCRSKWNASDQDTILEFDDGENISLKLFLSEIESAFHGEKKTVNVIAAINSIREYSNTPSKPCQISLKGNCIVFFPSKFQTTLTSDRTTGLLPFYKFIKPATRLYDAWKNVEEPEESNIRLDNYRPVFNLFNGGKDLLDFVF